MIQSHLCLPKTCRWDACLGVPIIAMLTIILSVVWLFVLVNLILMAILRRTSACGNVQVTLTFMLILSSRNVYRCAIWATMLKIQHDAAWFNVLTTWLTGPITRLVAAWKSVLSVNWPGETTKLKAVWSNARLLRWLTLTTWRWLVCWSATIFQQVGMLTMFQGFAWPIVLTTVMVMSLLVTA